MQKMIGCCYLVGVYPPCAPSTSYQHLKNSRPWASDVTRASTLDLTFTLRTHLSTRLSPLMLHLNAFGSFESVQKHDSRACFHLLNGCIVS